MDSSNQDQFDSLRREATKLERQLEDKISKYQQFAQRISSSTTDSSSLYSTSSSAAAADPESGGASIEEENMLKHDIQRLLNLLSDLLNTKLAPAAERSNKSQHTLLVKRYREILFDLSSDFNKTTTSIQRKRQQQELMGGTMRGGGGNSTEDEATAHLLRERNSIQNSMNASNLVLSQATDIHGDLRSQGQSLRNSQSVMARITSNVPSLNKIMDNIKRKKSRDDMIVSAVIAFCILFTLWYLFG